MKERLLREVWELLARAALDPSVFNPETFENWPRAHGSMLESLNPLLTEGVRPAQLQGSKPTVSP